MIPPGETWKDTAVNTFIMVVCSSPFWVFALKMMGCFDGP